MMRKLTNRISSLTLLGLIASFLHADTAIAQSRHDAILSKLRPISERNTPRRVLIKLLGSWQLDSTLKDPKNQRARIKQKAKQLVGQLSLRDPYYFETTPHIAATIRPSDVDKIASSPLVDSVFIDTFGTFQQFETNPIIGATFPNIWSKYGGAGKYIAIIDNGMGAALFPDAFS